MLLLQRMVLADALKDSITLNQKLMVSKMLVAIGNVL